MQKWTTYLIGWSVNGTEGSLRSQEKDLKESLKFCRN